MVSGATKFIYIQYIFCKKRKTADLQTSHTGQWEQLTTSHFPLFLSSFSQLQGHDKGTKAFKHEGVQKRKKLENLGAAQEN